MLVLGANFLGKQTAARKLARTKWKQDAGQLLDAHMVASSCIAELVEKKSGIPGTTNPSLQSRLAISAVFVQGMEFTEIAISEALYAQADTLLRQEMEALAAIAEVRAGSRAAKRTPNVKHLPLGLSRFYGELSAAAHSSDEEWLGGFVTKTPSEKIVGASTVAQYNKEYAMRLYTMQIVLIALMVIEIAAIFEELYQEEISVRYEPVLGKIFGILNSLGHLQDRHST